jgi:hypothetical protein
MHSNQRLRKTMSKLDKKNATNKTGQKGVPIASKETNIICPIWIDFDFYFDELLINPDIKLRRITDDEYQNIFNCEVTFDENLDIKGITHTGDKVFSAYNSLPVPKSSFIEYLMIHPNDFPPKYLIDSKDKAQIETLIFTLNLFIKNLFCPAGFAYNYSMTHYFNAYNYEAKKHVISEKSLMEIRVINDNILVKQSDKNEIIKNRFLFIKTNDNQKVNFVELVGLLESILLGNDSNELNYRFSLYLCFLFKNTEFKTYSEYYDIRSKLTHTGTSKKYNNEKYENLLQLTIEVVKLYFAEDINSDIISKRIIESFKQKPPIGIAT